MSYILVHVIYIIMGHCKEMCYHYVWDGSHWRSAEQKSDMIWLSYNKIHLGPKANKEIIDFDESSKDR